MKTKQLLQWAERGLCAAVLCAAEVWDISLQGQEGLLQPEFVDKLNTVWNLSTLANFVHLTIKQDDPSQNHATVPLQRTATDMKS